MLAALSRAKKFSTTHDVLSKSTKKKSKLAPNLISASAH